jgi:hypothetical protein
VGAVQPATTLRSELGPISPTALGSFVKLERCGQFLGWKYLAEDLLEEDSPFDESLLSPLYSETGTQFEVEELRALLDQRRVDVMIGSEDETPDDIPLDDTWGEATGDAAELSDTALDLMVEKVRKAHEESGDYTVVCFQPTLEGPLGAWDVGGKADIIVIRPARSTRNEPGEVVVDILEVKASRDEQTHHRIQAACYSKLIRNALSNATELSDNTTFRGRVVTRSNAISEMGYQNVEGFDLQPTETDVQMLLQRAGRLDRTLFESEGDDLDLEAVTAVDAWEMTNRMSRRCAGCEFHDVCYTRAVQEDRPELLGFPEGTQEDLAEVGVETLRDLGDLVEYDDRGYVSPTNRASEEVTIADEDGFERVREDVGLKDLERYSIAADVFSGEGSRDRPYHRSMIPDSGYNLPAGEPAHPNLPDSMISYPDRSLIRVYLFIQEDSIRERLVLLGGYVTNHRTEERRYVSAISDGLPGAQPGEEASEEKDDVEEELIQRFLRGDEDRDGLVDAIQAVAPDGIADELDDDDHGAQLDEPGFVHLYLYSPAQRQALTHAVKRHVEDGGDEFEALRTLLGLRTEIGQQDIDQEMVSVLQEEFVTRHLLRFLGFGIVQTVEQFERPDPDFDDGPPGYRTWGPRRFSWQHEVDGEPVELPLAPLFDEHLFENVVSYNQGNRVSFDLDSGLELTEVGENYEDQFPFAHRHTDDIPLEYIWGAFDELTPDWIDPESFDDAEKGQELQELIHRFRWTGDGEEEGRRFEPRHLRALAEKMAEAVEHIEASIVEWHKSSTVPKQALPLDQLLELEFDEPELALTAREYMDLEHGARDRQLRRDWRQSIPYRVSEGNSVLFRCTSTPEPDDETNEIEGELWEPGTDDVTHTESSISEGDWVVMTPVSDDQHPPIEDEEAVGKASDIARMPLVHVVEIEDGQITVAAPWNDWDRWPRSYHDYLHNHHRYVSRAETGPDAPRFQEIDGDANQIVIDEGASFILDEAHDDVVSYHCSRALGRSDNNHVLHWLNDLLTGDREEMNTEFCNQNLIEGNPEPDNGPGSFIETQFVEAESIDNTPNEPQRRFIREVDNHLVVVQGPPGTGKTSYTTTPAVLGRAYAFEQRDRSFSSAVSALSHDAVDEVFSNVRAVAEDCRDEGCFQQMKLVRVRPSDLPDDAQPYDERADDQLVEHIAYHHDDGAQRLRDLYDEFVLNEQSTTQFIIFGPPTSIRGAVDKIAPLHIDIDELERDGDWDPTVWELLELERGDLFDLAVVDEASMMSLPQLFLVGAFLRDSGQLLLAGDHRQMQPIRAHGWEEETRETIEETVPFLSALDFIRFLKGDIEEMGFIERESPSLDEGLGTDEQEQAVLPIYPLDQSFRLPEPVAELLTDLFYDQDGIELGGLDDRDPIPEGNCDSAVVEELTDPDQWISVLIHSGDRDERTSEIESSLAEEVVNAFDVVEPDDEDIENDQISAGVVIPFTAQRDLLQGELDDAVQAQTVEKFQGGERDLILMSMVASEPGYVNLLSEFLLSPYRFNVAASRMKRKLIIVASESIFQTSHPDADRYEDQLAWKQLYQRIGALNEHVEPALEGPVQEINPDLEEDAHFEIYHADLDEC